MTASCLQRGTAFLLRMQGLYRCLDVVTVITKSSTLADLRRELFVIA